MPGYLERKLARLPHRLLKEDWDEWLGITGGRRKGKSTLAIFNALVVEPDFDVESQMAWTADEYVDICLKLKKGQCAILDEPISGLLSFDAGSSENKSLYRAATIIGERNLFHQVLCPSEKRFGRAMREDYIGEDLHVVERGWGQARKIADLERHEVLDPPQVMDDFDFPRLPEKIETKYRKRKTEFVQEHRDTSAYDELRALEREMDQRLAPVLRRHNVAVRPDPVHVD